MDKKLEKYNSKRNFEKTEEPQGKGGESRRNSKSVAKDRQPPLVYVVQHHLARRDHYDFRLEWKGALLSWAVPKGPSYNPLDKRLAVMVEEHPFDYKDFEGLIPKGEYGGGTVMLWDEGFWEPLIDVDKGLFEGSLKFILKGERLKGKWALVRLKSKEEEKDSNWLLIKEKDQYAKPEEGISQFTESVRTARTMEEIENNFVVKPAKKAKQKNTSAQKENARINNDAEKGESLAREEEREKSSQNLKSAKKADAETKSDESKKAAANPFQNTDIMLAKLVAKPPKGEQWLFELKYDGYRILSYIEQGSARLMTRNGKDYSQKFAEVASSLKEVFQMRPAVLDGEIVVTDSGGKTDFQALQNYIKKPQGKRLSYVIFDILALDGEDLRQKPLTERKIILEKLLLNAPQSLTYSKHIAGEGEKCISSACKLEMEGVVGKLSSSRYVGGRNGDWVKIKCDNRQEFVIGGYTLTDKKNEGVSALLLGFYKEGELIYCGRTGTGIARETSLELESKFEKIVKKNPPFINPPSQRNSEKVTWLTPHYVAEIKYAEMTQEGLLRQASFKGLRIDKSAFEVKLEKAENKT